MEYFAAVEHLSDAELAGFAIDDLHQVRVAVSAYGIHVFGKLRIPALPDDGPAYIHFRAFTSGPDDDAKLHSIRTCLRTKAIWSGRTDKRICRHRGQGGIRRGSYLPRHLHQG